MYSPITPGIAHESVSLSDSDAASSELINPSVGKRVNTKPAKKIRKPNLDLSKAGPILAIE
jgi:hypothetical protein